MSDFKELPKQVCGCKHLPIMKAESGITHVNELVVESLEGRGELKLPVCNTCTTWLTEKHGAYLFLCTDCGFAEWVEEKFVYEDSKNPASQLILVYNCVKCKEKINES